MAVDLGSIEIDINADSSGIKKSFSDGAGEAGKKLQDSIRSLMGAVGGGAGASIGAMLPIQAIMSKIGMGGRTNKPEGGGGFTALTVGGRSVPMGAPRGVMVALKAAGVIGAFAAIAYAGKKVVEMFLRWGEEISQLVHKFALYNADLAQQAAIMQINQIRRDIQTAENIAPFAIETSRAMEDLKDAVQPLKDQFVALKGILATELAVSVKDFASNLGLQFQSLSIGIEGLNYVLKSQRIGKAFTDPRSWLGWAAGGDSPFQLFKETVETLKGQSKSLSEIREQLLMARDDVAVDNANRYLGTVGTELTDRQWNPWGTTLPQPTETTTSKNVSKAAGAASKAHGLYRQATRFLPF